MSTIREISSLELETDKSFEDLKNETTNMRKGLEEAADSAEEMVSLVKEMHKKGLI